MLLYKGNNLSYFWIVAVHVFLMDMKGEVTLYLCPVRNCYDTNISVRYVSYGYERGSNPNISVRYVSYTLLSGRISININHIFQGG